MPTIPVIPTSNENVFLLGLIEEQLVQLEEHPDFFDMTLVLFGIEMHLIFIQVTLEVTANMTRYMAVNRVHSGLLMRIRDATVTSEGYLMQTTIIRGREYVMAMLPYQANIQDVFIRRGENAIASHQHSRIGDQ